MGEQVEIAEVIQRVDSIEQAAGKYVKIRDRRMKMTEQEVEARSVLIDAMKTANVETYKTLDELVCTLTTTEKVKVKSPSDDAQDEE